MADEHQRTSCRRILQTRFQHPASPRHLPLQWSETRADLERAKPRALTLCCYGVRVASLRGVGQTTIPVPDRRAGASTTDRRKHPRGGRRKSDPHTNWRWIAWLFAAYAAYLSIRQLPETIRSLFKRTPTPS